MLEWAYSGVNISVPRNGGRECAEFLGMGQRVLETSAVLIFLLPFLKWSVSRLTALPAVVDSKTLRQSVPDPRLKQFLLVILSLVWGVEIGFKFSSRAVIFLFNPCHVTTLLQIYLLAARPSALSGALFRFQLNCMNGPILALLFPELDALNLPFETWFYWIQHTLMMVVPLYLIQLGGVYEPEELSDYSWCAFSYGVLLFYHFVILQGLGMIAQVNLNHMLCPAVRDPFDGPYYRILAILHQAILCPLLSKAFASLGTSLKEKERLRKRTSPRLSSQLSKQE